MAAVAVWLKGHAAALVALAGALGEAAHELGLVDPAWAQRIAEVGTEVAVVAAVVHAFVQAATARKALEQHVSGGGHGGLS